MDGEDVIISTRGMFRRAPLLLRRLSGGPILGNRMGWGQTVLPRSMRKNEKRHSDPEGEREGVGQGCVRRRDKTSTRGTSEGFQLRLQSM